MRTQSSLKKVRKYKLKEWGIFTLGCIVVSLVIAYEGIANYRSKHKLKGILWNNLFIDFLGQKRPDVIPNNSKLISLADLLSIINGIYIGSILTFLAPCRNIKKT